MATEHELVNWVPFDWAGTRILQTHTAITDKRRVPGRGVDTQVRTDLREWVTSRDREEIRNAIESMQEDDGLPTTRGSGDFDKRAMVVWRWVARNIEYVEDRESVGLPDLWQFPAETIALGKGDCEDGAALLASLLIGSGISPFCVRVVFGEVRLGSEPGAESTPHVWPVYKSEDGDWCILEATLDEDEVPDAPPVADQLHVRSPYHYFPVYCFNQDHVWSVDRHRDPREGVGKVVADHLRARSRQHRNILRVVLQEHFSKEPEDKREPE